FHPELFFAEEDEFPGDFRPQGAETLEHDGRFVAILRMTVDRRCAERSQFSAALRWKLDDR
ncbi:MAG: hypothetical protein ACREQP_11455, partial [Candidatus Binatia bacterium]